MTFTLNPIPVERCPTRWERWKKRWADVVWVLGILTLSVGTVALAVALVTLILFVWGRK